MPGVSESVTLDQPDTMVVDGVESVVQHLTEQIVQSAHEVTTLPPSMVVSEVIVSTLEPSVVTSTIAEAVTEATSSLVSEVTNQAAFVVDNAVHKVHEHVANIEPSTTVTIEQVTSTLIENIVQPVVANEYQPLQSEPVFPQEAVFVEPEIVAEKFSDRVNEIITEATQEFTTLLSTDDSSGNEPRVDGDHLSAKTLLTHDYVQWLHETRLILAISVSMVYLFTIFFIRRLLTKRSPFHLRNLLTFWNLGLSLFSIVCSTILVRSLFPWAKENGLGSTICSVPINDSMKLWLNLFTWSKLLELGNTLFVVLRKQKLRFIHVYYHLSTLIYTFYLFGGGIIASGEDTSTPAYYPVIVLINTTVQGIIYTYYTFRSRGCAPHKLLTMTLNLIHIIQFIAIIFILSLSLYHHLSPSTPIISTLSSIQLPASFSKLTLPPSLANLSLPPSLKSLTNLTTLCSPSMSTDIFGITVIGTNFILFVNHFRSNYVKPKTIKLL